jgi:hypothetical protein
VINQNDVPQIYELVMGDVNSNFTSLLARASTLLKDNRIPPAGFTTQHASYDTARISADALADADFNTDGVSEGTAVDYVHFHVPLSMVNGWLTVETNFYYQAVPPKWLDEMFQVNNPTIDTFQTMYDAADKSPFLVANDSISIFATAIENSKVAEAAHISPTASSGRFVVQADSNAELVLIRVYNGNGKTVLLLSPTGQSVSSVDLSENQAGIYYVSILTTKSEITRKILKY